MLYPYLFLFLFLNLLPYRSKRISGFISIVTVLFLIYVSAQNIYTGDQFVLNRDYSYNTSYVPYAEALYVGFANVCKAIGFSYIQCKCVWGIGLAILMFVRIRYYEFNRINLALLVWMLTSFSVEQEQNRFLYASIIIIFATKWLSTYKRKDLIKYIIVVLTASQVHTLAFFYLIFSIAYFRGSFGKIVRWFFGVSVVGVIALYFLEGRDLSALGALLYSIIKVERIKYWFAQRTNLGFLYPWLIQISEYGVLLYIFSKVKNSEISVSEKYIEYLNLCLHISKVMFVAMPFYLITTEFSRLQRPVTLMILIAVVFGKRYLKLPERIIPIMFLIGYIFLFNYFQYHTIIPFNTEHFIPMWTR